MIFQQMPDHQYRAAFTRKLDQLCALTHVKRQRFLDKHILPCFDSLQRYLIMRLGWGCYNNAANVCVRERGSEIVFNANIGERLRYSFQRRPARLANHPESAKLVKIPDVVD